MTMAKRAVKNASVEISLEKYGRMLDRIAKLTEENEQLKEGNHAHWTVIALDCVDDLATLKCSRCGIEREVEDGYIPDYCEGCGAKMDEEKESNHD